MVEPKPKVTLIGTELAQQGLEFVYEGEIEDCAPCSLKKTCNNLKKGKKYRIVGSRPTRHPCQVHLNGTRAVEVLESPIPALINADMAIKNTRIQYEFSCTRTTCCNFDYATGRNRRRRPVRGDRGAWPGRGSLRERPGPADGRAPVRVKFFLKVLSG